MSDEIKTPFELLSDEIKNSLRIFPAVHEDQVDNVFDGGVTCAVTTLSALKQSAGMKEGETREHTKLEDVILRDIRENLGTYQSVGERTLGLGLKTEQGLRTNFLFLQWYAREKLQLELIREELTKAQWVEKISNMAAPFMSSTSCALTGSAGHVVLVRGYMISYGQMFVCVNDPFGVHPYRVKKGGEGTFYLLSMFPERDSDGLKKYHTLSLV